MKTWSRMRSWLRAMSRRPQLDAEMQSELEFHIESYAADLVRSGLPREEAMRRARLELGSVAARKEECRESLGLRLWDDLPEKVRYRAPITASAIRLRKAVWRWRGNGGNRATVFANWCR